MKARAIRLGEGPYLLIREGDKVERLDVEEREGVWYLIRSGRIESEGYANRSAVIAVALDRYAVECYIA